MKLYDKIQEFLRKTGSNPTQLAIAAKISQPTMHRIATNPEYNCSVGIQNKILRIIEPEKNQDVKDESIAKINIELIRSILETNRVLLGEIQELRKEINELKNK